MGKVGADGLSTTADWAALASPVVVMPLGSFEQHGPHLPMAVDALVSSHFARVTAEALGAGLLPVQPILQCYEHSGFRGSVGVRPETAMALVRDIAESLERQHFKRFVLINGHGGNQAIGPAVRDWNRQDRPLKILLMNWYEWDDSPEGRAVRGGSLHADTWETSVMLALRPELVGDYRALGPAPADWPATAADLNHFGLGALRPHGYWGHPGAASPETGRAIVRAVEKNLPAAVRERLARLDAQPEYGGAGLVVVRRLEAWELADGYRLARAANWNQRMEDWALIRELWPAGLLAAVRNGAIVGTTAVVSYGDRLSWIAMVLVDPAMRRRGIATQLVTAGLACAEGCACVKLDATPAGREVYRKLGFADEQAIGRLAVATAPAVSPPPGAAVRPMTAADWPAVAALDEESFGAPRGALLGRLSAAAPGYAFVAEGKGGLTGYVLGRHGAHAEYAGPLTARDAGTARALAAAVFGAMRGRAVYVDVPERQAGWWKWLVGLGFAEQRTFMRMARGADRHPGRPARLFGIAGPEFG